MNLKTKEESDGLTLTGALFVLNCLRSWLGSVTVPMDGIEVDEFGPGSFLWCGLGKNLFKEAKLLECDLWATTDCTKVDGR